MTPAAIAAACGFLFSPPASYDALPLPPTAVVIEVRFADLGTLCRNVTVTHGHTLYGCEFTAALVAYVPTWATWPGTRECLAETRRHEEAHLKGWTHP